MDKVVIINIFNETFLFQSEKHLARQDRIVVESIIDGMWEDNEDLSEMDTYQLLEWLLEEIKKETGLELKTIGIDCEFSVKK